MPTTKNDTTNDQVKQSSSATPVTIANIGMETIEIKVNGKRSAKDTRYPSMKLSGDVEK